MRQSDPYDAREPVTVTGASTSDYEHITLLHPNLKETLSQSDARHAVAGARVDLVEVLEDPRHHLREGVAVLHDEERLLDVPRREDRPLQARRPQPRRHLQAPIPRQKRRKIGSGREF